MLRMMVHRSVLCVEFGVLELGVCRVLRDVIPPTPPGPEGSNGNGSLRAQWVARYIFFASHDGVWFLRNGAVGRSVHSFASDSSPRQIDMRRRGCVL